MRTPLIVAIPLAILVTLTAWWIGSRKHDFTTPPSGEELYALKQSLDASEEEFQTLAEIPDPPQPGPLVETPVAEVSPVVQQRIDLGAVQISPGLDEYTSAATQGADYMMKLAAALEEQGYIQRATLVWERLLDSTPAPPATHRTAAEEIIRLRPQLPLWTVDPRESRTLAINVGTTLPETAELDAALTELATIISEASSGIVTITPEMTVNPSPAGKRILPVAVWLSLPDKTDAATSIITFTRNLNDPAANRRNLLSTIYQLILGELESTGLFRPLPALNKSEDPAKVLSSRVTRLEWRALADALMRRAENSAILSE